MFGCVARGISTWSVDRRSGTCRDRGNSINSITARLSCLALSFLIFPHHLRLSSVCSFSLSLLFSVRSLFLLAHLYMCGTRDMLISTPFPFFLFLNFKKNKMDPGHNLLPRIVRKDTGKKCLVLDLDETLVHSSFKVCP